MLNNPIILGTRPNRLNHNYATPIIRSGYPNNTQVKIEVPNSTPEKLLTLYINLAGLPSYVYPEQQLAVCKQYLTAQAVNSTPAILYLNLVFADGYPVSMNAEETFYVQSVDLTTISHPFNSDGSFLREYIKVSSDPSSVHGTLVDINLSVVAGNAKFVNCPKWPYNPKSEPSLTAAYMWD